MATTQHPLVWDFYRKVEGVESLGGVSHYFDEDSQSLYLKEGNLATRVAPVPEGHWSDAAPSEEIQVSQVGWSHLRLDHPSNGVLYGVAADGGSLEFVRYVYMLDVSSILTNFSFSSTSDSPIDSSAFVVQNIGKTYFDDEVTLFHPGARMIVKVRFGDSELLPVCVSWLDEVDFNELSPTVPLSGRNTIGKLHDQTFDNDNVVKGASQVSAKALLDLAGIKKYIVAPKEEAAEGSKTFTFKPSDTLLEGVDVMNEYYRADEDNNWTVKETADGTVLYGYETWISKYLPNGYYVFNEGSDVFKRRTRRALDGAYSHVYVTGKNTDGTEQSVCLEVKSWPTWIVPGHKTKHISTETTMNSTTFQKWAQNRADELQYVGISEDFVSPFRPQILCGDVASVEQGDVAVSLGIITSLTHKFDTTNGFLTEFTVDSGGVLVEGDSYVVYNRTAKTDGYNRAQRVADLIKIIK